MINGKLFGKNKNSKEDSDDSSLVNQKEIDKIKDRLDSDENVVMSARQSRIRPGGAAGINPNTIFLTEKRVIIRNPIRLGLGEHIEEYYYRQITNVRLEKGLFSASLVFAIPGMTEISKAERKLVMWGRESEGTIDAIPKDIAEKMYEYIRTKINKEKKKKQVQTQGGDDNEVTTTTKKQEDPLQIIKTRYAKGEITKEQYETMREELT